MKVDLCITLKRLEKIRTLLKKVREVNIQTLSKNTGIPPTSISFYLQKYFRSKIKTVSKGREKLVNLIDYSISKEEEKLTNRIKKFELATKLRKEGFTYSEIKNQLIKEGFYMSDGQISERIRSIKIENFQRYINKITNDRKMAGSIGGKTNLLSGHMDKMRKKALDKIRKKALSRIPPSSKKFSKEKVIIIGHCLFDGSISMTKNKWYAVQYTNKSKALINKFKRNMKKIYNLQPSSIIKKQGDIYVIRYFSLAVALDILGSLKNGIPLEVLDAPSELKISFLKTFWDDEGAVIFTSYLDKKGILHTNRYLEAYCDKDLIREQLIKIHNDLGFTIREYGKRIRISHVEDLRRFSKLINFSQGIFVSYPKSKFDGLEKRKVLKMALERR